MPPIADASDAARRLFRLLPRAVRDRVRGAVDAVRARRDWRRMLREGAPSDDAPPVDADSICLLAWYFPPRVTGGTYRPAALARHGAGAGRRITVVTAPLDDPVPDTGRRLLDRIPPEVRIVRAASTDLQPRDGALPRLDGGAPNAIALWRAALGAFADVRPGVVVATGPPFHSFVAGRLLAARLDRPLVLEYRDEWTECPFAFVDAGPDDRRWEERCLSTARRVIFTTSSQLEHALDAFPMLSRDRCVVIPNGWEPEDVPSHDGQAAGSGGRASIPGRAAPRPDERRVISFTGNLGDHVLPEAFLADLARVASRRPDLARRIRIRFVGQKSRRAGEQLDSFAVPGMIETQGPVAKGRVGRILAESSALLLLNPPALARYVPGKTYEYLASGRLVLVHGAGGEVASLVGRLDTGHVVPEGDIGELERVLDAIAGTAGVEDAGDGAVSREWLEAHTRRALASRTLEVLDEAARPDC